MEINSLPNDGAAVNIRRKKQANLCIPDSCEVWLVTVLSPGRGMWRKWPHAIASSQHPTNSSASPACKRF